MRYTIYNIQNIYRYINNDNPNPPPTKKINQNNVIDKYIKNSNNKKTCFNIQTYKEQIELYK